MEYYGTSYWAPTNSLSHHGIKGMKWGVRRYQNADGTLTAAGRRRYGSTENLNNKQKYKAARKAYNKAFDQYYNKSYQAYSLSKKKREENNDRLNNALDKAHELNIAKREYKTSNALERSKKFNEKINVARAKNDKRLEDKFNQKVNAGKMSREEANRRLEDFRKGTKMVEAGQKKYDSIIKDYGNTRLKALNDPSYRKTEEYKKAGKEYAMLVFLNMEGSQSYAKLYYAANSYSDLFDD